MQFNPRLLTHSPSFTYPVSGVVPAFLPDFFWVTYSITISLAFPIDQYFRAISRLLYYLYFNIGK